MENKSKRWNATRIVSIEGGQREYTINNTKYIVEGRFEEHSFTNKDRTFADVMESIFSNEFIDLYAEMKKAESKKNI